jgi:hypothetical protein
LVGLEKKNPRGVSCTERKTMAAAGPHARKLVFARWSPEEQKRYYARMASQEALVRGLIDRLKSARTDWQAKCKRADLKFAEEVDDLIAQYQGLPGRGLLPTSGYAGLVCHLLGYEPEELEHEE